MNREKNETQSSTPPNSKVNLIAEFCQNHNGDFGLLSEMIHAAGESGATVGKMQTIYSDRVSFRPQFEEGLTRDGTTYAIKRPYQAEVERLKKLEISQKQEQEFITLCKKAGLTPMTTCFTRDTVQQIAESGFSYVKVASYDCASYPLLRELRDCKLANGSRAFEQIWVSTGSTYNSEIEYAAKLLPNAVFLHCVTIYPTPLSEMNLARMEYLKKFSARVGFSDHSLVARDGVVASKAAIYMGAEVIERHFTVLAADQSKDGPVSIKPEHMQELSRFSKLSKEDQKQELDEKHSDWKQCIGVAQRPLSAAELLNRDYFRGRFASKRREGDSPRSEAGRNMVYNWEETPLT